MPNTFAYMILIAWPFIAMLLYIRLPIVQATFWTIIGGYLFLPVRVEFDFPLIPPLDKESIPAISALIGCLFIKKINLKLLPKMGKERWIIILLIITPFFTMLNNQEVVNLHRGLTFHDAFSSIVNQYLMLLPFIIGMQIIKTYEDQLVLFKLLVISAFIYSIFVLFEVRMSPQLHTWIYGFFPHSWVQQSRFGGFRAIVFLGHGLLVSMYLAIALGVVSSLVKQKVKFYGVSPWVVLVYFFIVLLLNKTVSGFILGLLLFTAITLLSNLKIQKLSLLLIFVVILYPALTILELFPHEYLIQMAMDLNSDRGQSLAFRFHHENLLLEHAQQKIFFGWGGWGRNLLDDSVKDGYWIGVFGMTGLVGFVLIFGLTFLAISRASKSSLLLMNLNEHHLLASHALIVSIIMIDQLPNTSFYAFAIFLIGALLGRANNVRSEYQNHNALIL